MSEQYEYNGIVVGNISIDSNGVATGFGSNNYLLSPNVLKDATTSFEIVTAVEFNSVGTGTILDNYFFGPSGIMLNVFGRLHEHTLQLWISTDGSTTIELINTSMLYAGNTKIFFKISYNSSTGYVVSNSSDGETWTAVGSSGIWSKPYSGVEYLKWGLASDNTYPIAKMYLGDTYISVNGSKVWEALRTSDITGSVQISKGYYATASGKIFFPSQKLGLGSLSDGETVGCKNKLFAFSKDGAASARITAQANNDITTAHDVSVDLNHPVYLNHTKEYIAGGALIEPVWSYSSGEYVPNYTVVGSPTISSEFVASGFSSSNYLVTPSSIDLSSASTWEFITKITVGSTSSDQKIILGAGINFGITNSGYLHIWLRASDSSFIDDNIIDGSSVNNKYLKIEYTGSAYNIYSSDDGSTWNLLKNYSNSTKVDVVSTISIGNDGGEYWRGSIDLSKTSLSADGVVLWDAVVASEKSITTQKALVYDDTNDKTFWYPSATSLALSDFSALADRCNIYYVNQSGAETSVLDVGTAAPSGVDSSLKGSYYVYLNSAHDKILGVQDVPGEIVLETAEPVANYTVVGSPTISDNYIASSFSSRNGVAATTTLDTSKPWTIFAKIHSSSNVSSRQKFIGCANSADQKVPTLEFRNDSVYACMPNSSGSGWLFEVNTEFTPNTDTDYWFKYGWDGNTYSVEVSTDGESYTSIYTNSSQTAAYHSDSYKVLFGNDLYDGSYQLPFLGTVDLKECYFVVDGTKVWEAITLADHTEIEASPTDYWTFLGHASYDAQGESLNVSSMSATALTGHIMVGTNGTLAYSEGNAQFVAGLLPGQAYTGYDVTFTDNTHTAIASCDKVGERRRVYRSGTDPEVVIDYVVMSLEDYEAGFEGGSLPYASESYSLLASDPIEYTSTETFVVSTEAPSVIGTPYYNPETDTFYIYHVGLVTGYQALTCVGEANIIDSTGA